MNLTSSIHQPMIISLLIEIPNVVLDRLQQLSPTKFYNFFKRNNHGEQTKIFVKFMFIIFIAFATQKPSTNVLVFFLDIYTTIVFLLLKALPMCLKTSSVVKPTLSRSICHFLLFYNTERLVSSDTITPVTTTSY